MGWGRGSVGTTSGNLALILRDILLISLSFVGTFALRPTPSRSDARDGPVISRSGNTLRPRHYSLSGHICPSSVLRLHGGIGKGSGRHSSKRDGGDDRGKSSGSGGGRSNKAEKTPSQKLQKYRRLVQKLEQSKNKLEERYSRIELVRMEHMIKSEQLKIDLSQEIYKLKNKSASLNETYDGWNKNIDRYLLETPKKLTSLQSLKEFLQELQETQRLLTKQKYRLIKTKADYASQKENVALRAKILILERKNRLLESRLRRRSLMEEMVQSNPDGGDIPAGQWTRVGHDDGIKGDEDDDGGVGNDGKVDGTGDGELDALS
mmetsp:Transcript_23232/g.32489  ORF Transcript_23232/g.32489 Transcript_23232/m.32489 type:complete len:320 (-) Transcript_23232:96-1055(-)|eukprot:CAMPEP_0185269892 /NCGR_PEP_ID=MMETSP1359-20130426/41013_1 /TAXON_ID=552665 /ORGANISM="Bigelowiella longifila, Strain CCMP242" /LENGTH=319 /DNA_ID=CAMNT_0027861257 /DNA_START=20 /DNA_END=979 /DNA_ORIENTATION=-